MNNTNQNNNSNFEAKPPAEYKLSKILWLALIILIIIMVIALVLALTRPQPAAEPAQVSRVREAPAPAPVTLSLTAETDAIQAGQDLAVSLVVDTAGLSVDGVDVLLDYEPQLLEFVPDSVVGTDNFPQVLGVTNNGDKDDPIGSLKFSALAGFGEQVSGIKPVATWRFKALAPGQTSLAPYYLPGNTSDTNVSSGGQDVLQIAEPLSLTIQ